MLTVDISQNDTIRIKIDFIGDGNEIFLTFADTFGK